MRFIRAGKNIGEEVLLGSEERKYSLHIRSSVPDLFQAVGECEDFHLLAVRTSYVVSLRG